MPLWPCGTVMKGRFSALRAAIFGLIWLLVLASLSLPAATQGCADCQELKQKQYAAAVSPATPTAARLNTALTPATPVVRITLYWAEGCGHCHEVLDRILPPLQVQYGPQLEVRLIEVVSLEDINAFFDLAEAYGYARGRASVPFLLIGGRALIGVEQIERKLPGLIASALAAGGADWPAAPARDAAGQAAGTAEEGCGFIVPCVEGTAAAAATSDLQAGALQRPSRLLLAAALVLGLGTAIGGAARLRQRAATRQRV